jgi:hypothetical protein
VYRTLRYPALRLSPGLSGFMDVRRRLRSGLGVEFAAYLPVPAVKPREVPG